MESPSTAPVGVAPTPATGLPTAATPVVEHPRWSLAPGLELMGRVEGSGLHHESFLVRRRDGQVLQVSEIVHLVLTEVGPERPADEVAERVSAAVGRRLTGEGLAHLASTRLEPLGLLVQGDGAGADEDGPTAAPPRAAPLLALSLRGVILPTRAVRVVADLLRPLYLAPVVVLVVAAGLAVDVLVYRAADAGLALQQVLATPTLILGLWALLTVAGLVHELGHAAACRYGGAQPGAIGFGVYLLFPAFYTDVTDSYRLPRAGRLRVDLGGLYFNVLCVVALGGLYLATGEGLYFLALVVMHLQMLEQLVPAVRLDGYYVLSDLAGVPDLFARVGPVLRGLRPGAPPDPRIAELTPRARRIVVTWVLMVTPLLVAGAGWLLWHLPLIVEQSLTALVSQVRGTLQAAMAGDVVQVLLGLGSVVLLAVPLLGLGVLLVRLVRMLARVVDRAARRRTSAPPTEDPATEVKETSMTALQHRADPPPSANDFTDELMLPAAVPVPTIGWRRAVYRASGNTVNLGPGPKEQRRLERLQQEAQKFWRK